MCVAYQGIIGCKGTHHKGNTPIQSLVSNPHVPWQPDFELVASIELLKIILGHDFRVKHCQHLFFFFRKGFFYVVACHSLVLELESVVQVSQVSPGSVHSLRVSNLCRHLKVLGGEVTCLLKVP